MRQVMHADLAAGVRALQPVVHAPRPRAALVPTDLVFHRGEVEPGPHEHTRVVAGRDGDAARTARVAGRDAPAEDDDVDHARGYASDAAPDQVATKRSDASEIALLEQRAVKRARVQPHGLPFREACPFPLFLHVPLKQLDGGDIFRRG